MRHKRGSSRTSAACKGDRPRRLPNANLAKVGYWSLAALAATRVIYSEDASSARYGFDYRSAKSGTRTISLLTLLPGGVSRHPRTVMHPAKPRRARRVHTRPARHRHRRAKLPPRGFGGGGAAKAEAARLVDSGSEGGAFVGGETH